MRRGWKRFWRLGSVAAVATVMIAPALAGTKAQEAPAAHRHNELTLAGLRPGVSKLPDDEKKRGFGSAGLADATGVHWTDVTDGRTLRVESSANQIVETVTVSLFGAWVSGVWTHGNETALLRYLRSGRGLVLGDACTRVATLYGEPESRSPSVRGSLKLELLFYSFDWAGEDVPQSMEVSCDSASGRVVEITLASSTL